MAYQFLRHYKCMSVLLQPLRTSLGSTDAHDCSPPYAQQEEGAGGIRNRQCVMHDVHCDGHLGWKVQLATAS